MDFESDRNRDNDDATTTHNGGGGELHIDTSQRRENNVFTIQNWNKIMGSQNTLKEGRVDADNLCLGVHSNSSLSEESLSNANTMNEPLGLLCLTGRQRSMSRHNYDKENVFVLYATENLDSVKLKISKWTIFLLPTMEKKML